MVNKANIYIFQGGVRMVDIFLIIFALCLSKLEL